MKCAAGRHPSATAPRGLIISVSLAAVSALLSLFAIEAGLREYSAMESGRSFFSKPLKLTSRKSHTILPFRIFGTDLYYEDASGERHIQDVWGRHFQLRKPPNVIRIVCMGGSTTADTINRERGKLDYPTLLQAMLRERLHNPNIEVINAGFSAYATPHMIVLLEFDVVHWNADLVIGSENINDLTAAYWPHFRPDLSNKYSHPAYIPQNPPRFTWGSALWKNLQIYWFLKERGEELVHRGDWTMAGVRRRSYGLEPPKEAQAVFEGNLKTFVTIAHASGIKTLLATQPFNPSEESFNRHIPNKQYNDVVVYPLQDEFVAHHRRYNDIIARVAEDSSDWFLDNAARFGVDARYFEDLVHYTDKGAHRLAEQYADYLIENHIVE